MKISRKRGCKKLCSGAGQRAIESLVGNCLYFSNNDGAFSIQLNKEKKISVKNKLAKIYSTTKVPNVIDTTNKPEAFWDLVFTLKNEKVDKPSFANMKKYSVEELETVSQAPDLDEDVVTDTVKTVPAAAKKPVQVAGKKVVVKPNVVKSNVVVKK